MAVFYRVEDRDRWGMYAAGGLTREPPDTLRRPTPADEGSPLWGLSGVRFCFKDLRQLAEWVASLKTLDYLIANGFRIGLYSAEDPTGYVIGKKQCVFSAPKATHRGDLHLDAVRLVITLEENYDDQ